MANRGPVTALLLGGGAPTLTLQSGALAALHEQGVKFDIVSTAGAGMLIGLLYAAPKGLSPAQALAQTKEMGVHDSIYEHFPINFKVFHKPGQLADGYRRWLQSLPRMVAGPAEATRLWADWMALMHATWCPSDLGLHSLGQLQRADSGAPLAQGARLVVQQSRDALRRRLRGGPALLREEPGAPDHEAASGGGCRLTHGRADPID